MSLYGAATSKSSLQLDIPSSKDMSTGRKNFFIIILKIRQAKITVCQTIAKSDIDCGKL
jgi:hypothetical protein